MKDRQVRFIKIHAMAPPAEGEITTIYSLDLVARFQLPEHPDDETGETEVINSVKELVAKAARLFATWAERQPTHVIPEGER